MGRNIVKKDAQSTPEADAVNDGLAGPDAKNRLVERAGDEDMREVRTRGGTFGVMPEAVQRVHTGEVERRPEDARRAQGIPPARTFVLTEDASFMYGGMRTTGKKGKVFSETSYNIKHLLAQGLPLRETTPEPEPETQPEPEQLDATA